MFSTFLKYKSQLVVLVILFCWFYPSYEILSSRYIEDRAIAMKEAPPLMWEGFSSMTINGCKIYAGGVVPLSNHECTFLNYIIFGPGFYWTLCTLVFLIGLIKYSGNFGRKEVK